jgi:hypothetical protein
LRKLISQCGEITKEMFESALGSAWSFLMIPVDCCHLSVCMLLSPKQDKERRKEFMVGEFVPISPQACLIQRSQGD